MLKSFLLLDKNERLRQRMSLLLHFTRRSGGSRWTSNGLKKSYEPAGFNAEKLGGVEPCIFDPATM